MDIENDEPVFPLYWLINVFSLPGKQKTPSEKIRFPVNFPLSITDYRDSNYFMQGGIKNHYEKF